MQILLFYLIFIFLSKNPLDSVIKVKSHLEETVLIDSLISIGFSYTDFDFVTASAFANEAMNRSLKILYKNGIADSKYLLASIHFYQGNFKAAIDTSTKILTYYQKINEKLKEVKTLKLIGDSYFKMSEYDLAISLYNQAKKIIDTHKDDKLKNDINKILPKLLVSIGLLYAERGDIDIASEYYWNALSIAKKTNEINVETSVYINFGTLHFNIDKFDSALFYFKKANKLARENNNQRFLLRTLTNMGQVLNFLNRSDEALKCLLEAYNILENYDDKLSMYNTLFTISQIYMKTGDYANALRNLESSKELALEIGNKRDLIPIYYQLALANEKLNKITSAIAYYKLYAQLKDSLYDIEKESLYAELQANMRLEDEKNKNKINEITIESQNKIMLILIISLIFSLILLFIIIFLLRIKTRIYKKIAQQKDEITKVNLELNELNATKDKFFSIIAHDIKSPLAIITNVSEYLLSNSTNISSKETNELIERIKVTSQSLSNLLENLLEWSRSQTGKIKFNPQMIDLHNLIFETTFLLRKTAANKGIIIENNVNKDTKVYADRYMLEVIMRNLVSNAIKFTPENGKVSINATNDINGIKISVEDNGIGIPEDMIPKVFDIKESIIRPGTNNERGTGLGLILCKEFIEKHNGKIWFESQINVGSKFIFTLNSLNN